MLIKNIYKIKFTEGLFFGRRRRKKWRNRRSRDSFCYAPWWTVCSVKLTFSELYSKNFRPSGDAFVSLNYEAKINLKRQVLFAEEALGKKAIVAKNKQRIGTRYIELFRTTQGFQFDINPRALLSSVFAYLFPFQLKYINYSIVLDSILPCKYDY